MEITLYEQYTLDILLKTTRSNAVAVPLLELESMCCVVLCLVPSPLVRPFVFHTGCFCFGLDILAAKKMRLHSRTTFTLRLVHFAPPQLTHKHFIRIAVIPRRLH